MMKNFWLFLLGVMGLVSCAEKPLDPNKPVYVTVQTTMVSKKTPVMWM